MGRKYRAIYSNHVYELCMRTRQGKPFVHTLYMNTILRSVIARVQRNQKVIVCHYLWMTNHVHMVIVAKDQAECTAFYGEIQKQLTEAIKRLFGLSYLTLWKSNSVSVIPLYDVDTVCDRIAYLYANPASADMAETIDDYEIRLGLSSWKEFNKDKLNVDATHSQEVPWVRAPYIKKILSPLKNVTRRQDDEICQEWLVKAEKVRRENERKIKKGLPASELKDSHHDLVVMPNAWMRCFGIETEEEVKEVNEKVEQFLYGMEQIARDERKKSKKKVASKNKLFSQGIDLTYIPKKPTERIYVYSTDPEFHKYLVEQFEIFCDQCAECYRQWKLGNFSVEWPPGAMRPPLPKIQNDFCPHMSNVY